MNSRIYEQILGLFIFIFVGILIGILFDIFRIIRKSFKTSDFITYLEDVLFWILTGIVLLFAIFAFNNGELRIYIFIALIFGMITYLLTISKYFITISVNLLNILKKIFRIPINFLKNFIKNFVIRPFSFIIQNIREKTTNWIKKPIKKTANMDFPNIYDKIGKLKKDFTKKCRINIILDKKTGEKNTYDKT